MHKLRRRDGFAMVTVLAILAIFLAVCFVILTMTVQNSVNFGNAYQKQRYYDVAEAGIDRGLRDLDSVLPSPGSTALSATPPPPPATPSGNQTPLPNVPNVPYYYSYWYNASGTAKSTPDPLATFIGAPSSPPPVNVPANGAVIWSYTTTGSRDVAVETVVSRFGTQDTKCAICAGQNVTVSGSQNFSPPPGVCGNIAGHPDKICSDPNSSPSPFPTAVPIVLGGTYASPPPSWNCGACAYGDGTSTPNPTYIQQNASTSTLSQFLAPQGTLDAYANASYWQTLSTTTSNVKYLDCSSGCTASQIQADDPGSGQVTFINGNINISQGTVGSYSGMFIVSGCLTISGKASMTGTATALTVVLGTDTTCSGVAASIGGGGNSPLSPWQGGTLYTANGSANISGNGSIKTYSFYGAVIAAGSVTVTGNGFFAWQSANISQLFGFGPFAIDSFAQY